jgi:hypothetical protein
VWDVQAGAKQVYKMTSEWLMGMAGQFHDSISRTVAVLLQG